MPSRRGSNYLVSSTSPAAASGGLPGQSPLFHAQQAGRYERQRLIAEYSALCNCRLIVVIDAIFSHNLTPFEELIYDNPRERDIHLLLATPGGDGETAVRMVRAAQARCRKLTVIVPDVAKSAGTLIALGAHSILMAPASDLGPIDPQFEFPDGSLVAAKDIIAAVDDASKRVQEAPATFPLHAAMLSDVTGLMVQRARSELLRTGDLLEEALSSNPDRTAAQVAELKKKLRVPLIQRPKTHAAIFNAADAKKAGLPAVEAEIEGEQWQRIWRLWAKYWALGLPRVYEGEKASVIMQWPEPSQPE
jgi:Serine dehydrogenase proteinase